MEQSIAASKYDVPVSTVSKWVAKYSTKSDSMSTLNSKQDKQYSADDIAQMEKRIKDLEEDNEILKKAMTIFAQK